MSSRVKGGHLPYEGRGQRGSKGERNGQVRSSAYPCVPRARDLQQVGEVTEEQPKVFKALPMRAAIPWHWRPKAQDQVSVRANGRRDDARLQIEVDDLSGRLDTYPDSLDEDDETFTVTLSSPTNADISDATAKGTITDDDSLPVLQIGTGGTDEADAPALSVSVTPASGREVMVTWTATIESGNTAEAADFTDLSTATGTLTIPAGRSSYVFFLNGVVADDSLNEDIETFSVTLSSPVNATLSIIKAATVSIRDDDPTPTVTVADAAANEGDKVEFVVTLSAVSGRDVDVDYATSVATGDGAVSGTDFTAASGTLTIAAADSTDTGTIEVQTTQDDASESAETFTLTLSNPKNATLGTPSAATGTINDDDGTTLSTDATLNALSLGTGVTLSPAFASGTTTYTASVGEHLLRRAGAGNQRRGHRRVVGLGQRHDGRAGGPADAEHRRRRGDRG